MKTLEQEATELAQNKLLTLVLTRQRQRIIEAWRQSNDPKQREQHWHAQRQLELLAGAIDDGIREYGGSRGNTDD